jgi:pSer/pThr/pTyr-binding forkhead associated (FHA) protein
MLPYDTIMSGTPTEVGTEALPKKGGRSAAAFRLTVVDGPDKGLVGRVEAAAKVLVGTSEACGIRLSDRSASRRHLSLEVHDASLRVRDLESTNGVFVQGVRVFEAALSGGEQLRVGSSLFLVEAVAPSTEGVSKLIPE